jgi:hypothetical protein
MRLQVSLALLLGALSACEPPLPPGAYDPPKHLTTGGAQGGGFEDVRPDTGAPSAPPPGTAGGAGHDASVGVGGGDGGATGGTPGGDAGAPMSTEAQRLQKLAGLYLMRMDTFSTTNLMAGILGTIGTRDRISHLSAVEVRREGETLVAYERLCHQTFQHTCTTSSCKSLATTMSPAVINHLVAREYVTRKLSLSGNQLTADPTTVLIGYDAKGTDTSIPTTISDTRVWDTDSSRSGREGLLLNLRASVSFKNIDCNLYNVQTLTSSFEGPAGASDGSLSLVGSKGFTLTTDTKGETLGSSNTMDCDPNGQSAQITKRSELVRFAAVTLQELSNLWDCPAKEEWDRRLPPAAP